MSRLSLSHSVVIFDDLNTTNNPRKRIPDWTVNVEGISVSNPRADEFSIPPNSSQVVFSGQDTTGIDGVMSFTVTLSPLSSSTYRFTTAGAANFRTDRTLAFNTNTIAITINNNATATFTRTVGAATFNSMQVGDILWVPGAVTGDSISSPFNTLNQGAWQVLSVSSAAVTAIRAYGQPFQGVAETQPVTANNQLLGFSATGVQIGDIAEITGAFSQVTWGDYPVTNIAPQWFEITSANSLPLETGIVPTTSQLVFYNNLKSYVRIEVDQLTSARFNADTTDNVKIAPVLLSDGTSFGSLEKFGPAYALTLVNKSATNTLHAVVISCN